mgnify:CR=1 FL=1
MRTWSMSVFAGLLILVAPLAAAEEPAPAVEEPSAGQKAAEEEWIFEPLQGRVDAFHDIERRLILEKELQDRRDGINIDVGSRVTALTEDKVEAAIVYGQKEAEIVDKLILARQWDEAIQRCDKAMQQLEKYQEHPVVQELRETFARSKQQATDAKIFEEAQAKFDALGIKVEGILWAPEGSLAIISGEARALRMNDRTKDCVIVNIDTNRVDFLFRYLNRRFEFQRYVGEEVGARTSPR